jgi:hypothetical protein
LWIVIKKTFAFHCRLEAFKALSRAPMSSKQLASLLIALLTKPQTEVVFSADDQL